MKVLGHDVRDHARAGRGDAPARELVAVWEEGRMTVEEPSGTFTIVVDALHRTVVST